MSIDVMRDLAQDFSGRTDALWHKILSFNAAVPLYVHPSFWHSAVPEPWPAEAILAELRSSARGLRALRRWVMGSVQLEKSFFFDFREPRRRLALLDPAVLLQLVLYAGITYYASNIAQIVQKQALLALKEAIGDKAYLFAVKKAPLFSKAKPMMTSLNANPSNLYASILLAGQRMLEYVFAQEDPALTQRLVWKFPKSFAWNFNRITSDENRQEVWAFLYRLLTKELDPELGPYFA
jgi:hypothetical protein